ncbi:uncharacterized protein [Amphiura filiformis]|uniref:uncharacterized protein n=1 Tax=Amphiura filiformis TaxID=82378 RepID=UPI003B22522C
MPHISAYDLSFDSDDEDFLEGNGNRKKKEGSMLIDDILEEYDAKLEQEKARKLKEEIQGSGMEPSTTDSSDDFIHQAANDDVSQSDLFISDIPLENTYKPNLPLTRFGTQSTLQNKLSLPISQNNFGIHVHNNFSSKLIAERAQSNPKVFVRISDCAQTATPTPIRVRIRHGSVTELEPDKELKPVAKPKTNSSSALKPEALGRLEDPFSDLPSDLLPGLYELPNLGFNESTTTTSTSTDNKEANSNKTPSISKVVYEKNIHTYSKTPDRIVQNVDKRLANVQRIQLSNASNIKVEPLDPIQTDEVEGADVEMKQLAVEDDDGSYVVIVIPKHATVEDVMRTLRTAGNEPVNSEVVKKIVSSSKRKSSQSPFKTVLKKRRLVDAISPTVMEIEKPAIKQEPKSDLNASCTLAAMSMLAAAEKGIHNGQVGSDTMPVVKGDPEVITINDGVEQTTEGYQGPQVPIIELFRELDPEAQHIEFGVFNDHTYANLQVRYTVPNLSVTLPVEESVPEAAAMVTVQTDDVMEEVGEAAEVRKAIDVKVEIKQEYAEVKDDKAEEIEDVAEKIETDELKHDVEMKEESNAEISHDISGDDLFCRRSHRLSLKKIPRWGPGNSNRDGKAKKVEPNRAKKVELNQVKEDTNQAKTVESKQQRTTAKCTKCDDAVKWHLFASRLRCRLCEVMCHQLIDMKYHIVQVHSNQEDSAATKRVTRGKKVRERVLSSDVLSDFEVSALSAIVRLCPTCDKYVPENRIAGHLENHAGLKVTCSVCGATFKNRTKLGIHKEICSSAKTECKCKMCGKEYSSKSDLSMHQRFHHQDRQKKKKYRCERCDKVCRSTGALKVHVAIHFTVKPFECPDCGKGFSQKINMEYHKMVHVGDSPHQCDMCTATFAQSVSLKTHKKKQHGVDMLKKRKL